MINEHKGYRISTGVINIVFGSIWIFSYLYLYDKLHNIYKDYVLIYYFIGIMVPALLIIPSGIMQIKALKNKKLYLISAILLFVIAGINFLTTFKVNAVSIYAIIIGIFNIKYSKE